MPISNFLMNSEKHDLYSLRFRDNAPVRHTIDGLGAKLRIQRARVDKARIGLKYSENIKKSFHSKLKEIMLT